MKDQTEIRMHEWIKKIQSHGKYFFSLELLEKELPNYTAIGAKRALSRMTTKGNIISIYKGYYLIIPPQYSSKGILPPAVFLDEFMKHLQRPYYLALLNA